MWEVKKLSRFLSTGIITAVENHPIAAANSHSNSSSCYYGNSNNWHNYIALEAYSLLLKSLGQKVTEVTKINFVLTMTAK